jgi:hypothetical protein
MEALTDREQAALTRVLRELGALDRQDEIARDFAQRGVHALLKLDPRAEEMFDDAYWRIEPDERELAHLKGQRGH